MLLLSCLVVVAVRASSCIQRYICAAQHFDKINNKNYVVPAIMITAFASFTSFVRWAGCRGVAEGRGQGSARGLAPSGA